MLELKNISYVVTNDGQTKEILKDVSLTLDERFVAFTGPNGGGKSTLAKIIMGIYTPTSGQIIFNGQDITNLSITERARLGISFAFQQPVKFKGITVYDLIKMASGENLTVAKVCEYLSEVGLCAKEYVNREINASLSGGELKRIEIATTMARKSQITIFDEPEAGIDLWSFNNLIKVFERLFQKTQGSVLIISHQERILNIADRVIVIANGKIKDDGKKEDILSKILTPTTCSALDKDNSKKRQAE
ncbi:MAG: ATP-binding cassette domain-containing protein [Clostridia bacterium]|nr:ATP-binding cassette domain-containing protein [Clostridia bacterium]